MKTMILVPISRGSDKGQPREKVCSSSHLLLLASLTLHLVSNQPTPVYRSAGSDSDSDGYVGARRNIPTKKERQRQHLVASGRLPPSQAEVRFSARRTAQVTNYNEEEEDDFEESEAEATPNYWANTAEETGPIIDKILDHRPVEGTGIIGCVSFHHNC